METAEDFIGLRFDGNGIKPSAVKASEIADLIKSFEYAISDVLELQSKEYNDTFVYLSLDEIKENCLTIKYKSHRPIVIGAYLTIANAFQTNDYNSLPKTAIDELKTFTRFTKKYNCAGSFTRADKTVAQFNKDTNIVYTDEGTLSGETVIYGEVRKAGGDNPRATIIVNNDYSASFDVKKEIAIELAKNLYKDVGLKGIARWDKKNYKILDFKAQSVVLLDYRPLSDTFLELNQLFGNHLDDII
jgi:hypothetical protein